MDLITLATALKPDGSLEFTLTVIIAGLGGVLVALFLLIVVFSIFGKLVSRTQERAKRLKDKKTENTSDERAFPDISEMKVEEALLPIENDGIPAEVIAAISAAVYMLEGEGAKIKSVKRRREPSRRKVWANAAVTENTRPF